jgi:hypothetical protein
MVFVEMKFIMPLEIGSETYQRNRRAFGHLSELEPKSLLKTCMKVKSKDAS